MLVGEAVQASSTFVLPLPFIPPPPLLSFQFFISKVLNIFTVDYKSSKNIFGSR